MVRGVFTADVHGNIAQVVKAVEYAMQHNAILILGGDIAPHAQYANADGIRLQRDFFQQHLPPAIAALEGRVYLLMGNEDVKCNADVFDDVTLRHHWHQLHGKRWPLGKDLDIVGYSCVPCTPFMVKDWERVDCDQTLTRNSRKSGKVTHNGEWYPAVVPHKTIAEELADDVYIPNGRKTIFVSHCPPHDTLADAAKDNQHFGSKAIRVYIERYKPIITLHGHLHECVTLKGSHLDRVGESWVCGVGNHPVSDEVALIDFDTDKPDEANRVKLRVPWMPMP